MIGLDTFSSQDFVFGTLLIIYLRNKNTYAAHERRYTYDCIDHPTESCKLTKFCFGAMLPNLKA